MLLVPNTSASKVIAFICSSDIQEQGACFSANCFAFMTTVPVTTSLFVAVNNCMHAVVNHNHVITCNCCLQLIKCKSALLLICSCPGHSCCLFAAAMDRGGGGQTQGGSTEGVG